MLAREETMSSPMLQDELHKVLPVVNTQGSDSAMLDNTLEFLTMSGMDLPLAVMITIRSRGQTTIRFPRRNVISISIMQR